MCGSFVYHLRGMVPIIYLSALQARITKYARAVVALCGMVWIWHHTVSPLFLSLLLCM